MMTNRVEFDECKQLLENFYNKFKSISNSYKNYFENIQEIDNFAKSELSTIFKKKYEPLNKLCAAINSYATAADYIKDRWDIYNSLSEELGNVKKDNETSKEKFMSNISQTIEDDLSIDIMEKNISMLTTSATEIKKQLTTIQSTLDKCEKKCTALKLKV